METAISSMPIWLLPAILIAAAWEMVWKLIALWRAGRNNHLVWFICIGLTNTIGVLPIIYILMHRRKQL